MIGLMIFLSLRFQPLGQHSPSPMGWLSYIVYLQNWYMPVQEPHQDILGHFWSLGVEEQFYLVWPAIVWMTNRRRLVWICAGGCVFALLLRITLNVPYHSPVIFMNTFTRVDTLLCGAFCAIAVREPELLRHVKRAIPYVALISILGMFCIEFFGHELAARSVYTQTLGFSFLAFGFGALVLSAYLQNGSRSILNRCLSCLPLRIFGKYSYGIYVYHILVFTVFFISFKQRGWLLSLLMVFASLFVAVISYELFEKQFLRLKSRFTPMKTNAGTISSGTPAEVVVS